MWKHEVARWSWLVAGLGGAFYTLRLSLETDPPCMLCCLAIVLLCPVAAYAGWRFRLSLGPLWLLWLYIAWPWPSLTMAFSVGAVSILAVLIHNLDRVWGAIARAGDIGDALIFVAALATYVATLSPTILPADSGEFQIVAATLGVAHPPGYALYTLIARLFTWIPLGEIAWRVSLASALTGALTLAVVARTARRIAGAPWAGLAASVALGVSTTFWAQSTTANIRSLTVLFTALCFLAMVYFVQRPPGSKGGARALIGLALSFGLGVSHHYSLAFLLPVFGAVVLWHDPGLMRRVRAWPRVLLAFLLPFGVDLYIVARAITGAPFGTDDLSSARRVIDHLLGTGFGGDMFAFLRRGQMPWREFLTLLWERCLVIENILNFQFGPLLLIVSIVGFAWLLWKNIRLAVLLSGTFATMAFVVVTYRAPQSVEYLMPAYVPVALCLGCALGLISQLAGRSGCQRSPDRSRPIAHPPGSPISKTPAAEPPFAALLTAILLLPILFLGQAHLPSYVQLRHDRSARAYAESVLLRAPTGAHILSSWHWYTPLRYLQLVEGKRADVDVTYIYPEGTTEMPQAWAERITDELEKSGRPLIVTNRYPTYGDLPYRLAPLGEAFLVYDEPSFDMPSGLEPVDAAFAASSYTGGTSSDGRHESIRILGYQVLGDKEVYPGDQITVELAWQPLVPLNRSYSFFVHLIGADGKPLGQHDIVHVTAPLYRPGEVLVDRFQLPVYLSVQPGVYQLIAGVYFSEAGSWQRLILRDGSDTFALDRVQVSPVPLAPVTTHPLHRHFDDGPTLIGVDYDDSVPGQRRVFLHWALIEESFIVQLYTGDQAIGQAQIPALNAKTGCRTRGYASTTIDLPATAEDISVALIEIGNGVHRKSTGPWGSSGARSTSLPRPEPRQYYLPFDGGLALVAVHTQQSWKAGGSGRVVFRFVGLQPIVGDYVVSAKIRGEAGRLDASDGVPALGAIPTFKWIRGSLIRDVHILHLPSGTRGQVELALAVYNAFTTSTLLPLDERITHLQRATVPIQQIPIAPAGPSVSIWIERETGDIFAKHK